MKLLIVDDDKVSRAALRELIGNPPEWEIVEAEDGQKGLDLVCDGLNPDLCILDLNMPRLSGSEFLQRIRRDTHLRPFKTIVTSTARDRDTIVSLAKLQISGYLLKPYDPEKTRALLQPLLTHSVQRASEARNLLERNVLVVEDDAVVKAAIQEYLSADSGWKPVFMTDGQEAWDRLQKGPRPDLLLTDLTMPRLDGTALIKKLREDPALRNLRIAVISGSADRERLNQLIPMQLLGFLVKPFNRSALIGLLNQAGADAPPR